MSYKKYDFDVQKIINEELIHLSILSKKSEILQFLLQNANINISEEKKENMMYSVIQIRSFNCLKVLIDSGFIFKDNHAEIFKSPLELCAFYHFLPAIKYYVEVEKTPITSEIIYYAIDSSFNKNSMKSNKVIKYIINHASDEEINKRIRKETIIHTLNKHDVNIEITKMVLERGANVNSLDDEGHSTLYWLSFHNRPNDDDILFCELLYEYGLDINMECFNCKGQKVDSILGSFIQQLGKNLLVIEWLLQHGARSDVLKYPNRNNKTIRDIALKARHKKLSDLFKKYASQ